MDVPWCRASIDEENRERLHVHHRWYENGCDPWEGSDASLITLCQPCHDKVTEATRWLKDSGRYMEERTIVELVMFLKYTLPALKDLCFREWLWHRWTIMGHIPKPVCVMLNELEAERDSRDVLSDAIVESKETAVREALSQKV